MAATISRGFLNGLAKLGVGEDKDKEKDKEKDKDSLSPRSKDQGRPSAGSMIRMPSSSSSSSSASSSNPPVRTPSATFYGRDKASAVGFAPAPRQGVPRPAPPIPGSSAGVSNEAPATTTVPSTTAPRPAAAAMVKRAKSSGNIRQLINREAAPPAPNTSVSLATIPTTPAKSTPSSNPIPPPRAGVTLPPKPPLSAKPSSTLKPDHSKTAPPAPEDFGNSSLTHSAPSLSPRSSTSSSPPPPIGSQPPIPETATTPSPATPTTPTSPAVPAKQEPNPIRKQPSLPAVPPSKPKRPSGMANSESTDSFSTSLGGSTSSLPTTTTATSTTTTPTSTSSPDLTSPVSPSTSSDSLPAMEAVEEIEIPKVEEEPPLTKEELVLQSQVLERYKGTLSGDARQRQMVIDEILSTEEDYVKDLQLTIDLFLKPLRDKKIIEPKLASALFSNIEVLHSLNKQFLFEFRKRLRASLYSNMIHFGDIFRRMADYFKMYTVYCANQPTAVAALEEAKKNINFVYFIKDVENDEALRGLALYSFLIKPVQRICKYPLFIKDLLRHTPETSPDFVILKEAFLKIDDIVTHINEGTRRIENQQKMLSIQQRIKKSEKLGRTLVTPARRFVREGKLLVQSDKGKVDCFAFLFNDLMLLAKQEFGQKKLKLVYALPLNTQTKIATGGEAGSHLETSGVKNNPISVFFRGSTPEETNEWTNDIRNLTKPPDTGVIAITRSG